jgi:hypothetical protein
MNIIAILGLCTYLTRCVQLAWTPGYDNPAAWAEFVNKLKDGLLTSFDLAVSQREEDVKRSESQRQMPGWNFCTFFILKVPKFHLASAEPNSLFVRKASQARFKVSICLRTPYCSTTSWKPLFIKC